MWLSSRLSCGRLDHCSLAAWCREHHFASELWWPPCGETMAHFRLHTENEGEFVIVATINSISSCNYPELSEVSSEFTELERTVIFGLLVKSDGEAEMAVDAENVK